MKREWMTPDIENLSIENTECYWGETPTPDSVVDDDSSDIGGSDCGVGNYGGGNQPGCDSNWSNNWGWSRNWGWGHGRH